MKSSESNPPVKTKSREATAGREEKAFPEELMRLARPPRGITAEVKDGVLTIRRRWYVGLQAELINVLNSGLIVDLIVVLFYGLVFGGLIGGLFGGLIDGLVFGGLIGLLYFGLLLGLHRNAKPTALMAAGDVLQVKYSPGGPYSREFRTDMTHQIFVVASLNWNGRSISQSRMSMPETFTVKARLHSGERVVLFDDLTKPQAKFIEHRLEAFLGIANRRVEGEVED